MSYPTIRAVLLCALGAPLGLALGFLGGAYWLLGVAWAVGVGAAVVADSMLATGSDGLSVEVSASRVLFAGRDSAVEIEVRFAGRAPRELQMTLDASERLVVRPAQFRAPVMDGRCACAFTLMPERRGHAGIEAVWLRWTGPLGLAFRQRVEQVELRTHVTLDFPAVNQQALRLLSDTLMAGAHLQSELGGASEFHALVDYQPGMNPRTIDWKQSARHRALLAKEFEAERNHHIVLAVDSGRLMCEPVRGAPRVDQVLRAGLLLAFGALKAGDRVGLYAFDERPRLWTGALAGHGAFAALQRLASGIDYAPHETNYTLGLVQLDANLKRRSLVVVFTEFTDSTTAELMLENVARLMRTHLVLFVVAEDDELEALERHDIAEPADVTRAVLAGALAAERELVIGKLRRMGVDVLQTDLDRLGPALLARYVQIKQKDLL